MVTAVAIETHDSWSIYQEKSAQLGDGFVRWIEDADTAYVIDLQAGPQTRGSTMLSWLAAISSKEIHAIGVVEDAEEFWDLMEERGLISGQSDRGYLDYFGLRRCPERGV